MKRRPGIAPFVVLLGVLATFAATASSWQAAERAADSAQVAKAELQESGVDPARLIFAITEPTAVANIPAAQAFAARLADLGCRFALDARAKPGDEAAGRGRGAGFGSFYYLKHLPFDYLKIDGEFVRHCAEDRTDQLVIQAVVDIARGLGKRTVAEQAGDDATIALLRELGVDQAQGYFLGRPAPLAEWLASAAAF
jgi:EAL domain-containing protein (putative c-di-GMP-specific phosphodiesterase class I)